MPYCSKCEKHSTLIYYYKSEWLCSDCRAEEGYKSSRRGVYDANGRLRDRSWLDKKLSMTRTDRKWEADIKSRRISNDGNIIRT